MVVVPMVSLAMVPDPESGRVLSLDNNVIDPVLWWPSVAIVGLLILSSTITKVLRLIRPSSVAWLKPSVAWLCLPSTIPEILRLIRPSSVLLRILPSSIPIVLRLSAHGRRIWLQFKDD